MLSSYPSVSVDATDVLFCNTSPSFASPYQPCRCTCACDANGQLQLCAACSTATPRPSPAASEKEKDYPRARGKNRRNLEELRAHIRAEVAALLSATGTLFTTATLGRLWRAGKTALTLDRIYAAYNGMLPLLEDCLQHGVCQMDDLTAQQQRCILRRARKREQQEGVRVISPTRTQKHGREPSETIRQTIIAEYQKGTSIRKIAGIVQRSEKTVLHHLQYNGVWKPQMPPRQRWTPTAEQRAAYDAGVTIRVIAEQAGIGRGIVQLALARARFTPDYSPASRRRRWQLTEEVLQRFYAGERVQVLAQELEIHVSTLHLHLRREGHRRPHPLSTAGKQKGEEYAATSPR